MDDDVVVTRQLPRHSRLGHGGLGNWSGLAGGRGRIPAQICARANGLLV